VIGGGVDAPSPPLTLAVPKGRILEDALPHLSAAGLDLSCVLRETRRLVHEVPAPGLGVPLRIVVLRAADVPTWVEHGIADLGLAGLDVVRERGSRLLEPVDLGTGRCRLAVAEPVGGSRARPHAAGIRVASKYPNLTRAHYLRRGEQVEIIHLHGSVEIACVLGLSDRVVDLVDTGGTLRANGLVETETILEVSTRVVVNRARDRLRHRDIDALCATLARAAELARHVEPHS